MKVFLIFQVDGYTGVERILILLKHPFCLGPDSCKMTANVYLKNASFQRNIYTFRNWDSFGNVMAQKNIHFKELISAIEKIIFILRPYFIFWSSAKKLFTYLLTYKDSKTFPKYVKNSNFVYFLHYIQYYFQVEVHKVKNGF